MESVQIPVAEEVSVWERAGYYDQSSVIRDMIQSHLLQIVTIIVMEPLSGVDADSLRNRKVDFLKAIRRWTPKKAVKNVVSALYKGYLSESSVIDYSTT